MVGATQRLPVTILDARHPDSPSATTSRSSASFMFGLGKCVQLDPLAVVHPSLLHELLPNQLDPIQSPNEPKATDRLENKLNGLDIADKLGSVPPCRSD